MLKLNNCGGIGTLFPQAPEDTDIRPASRFGQYFPRIAVYLARNFTPTPTYAREFLFDICAPF